MEMTGRCYGMEMNVVETRELKSQCIRLQYRL